MARKNAKKPKGLTPRQERFVTEYLVDLNATQAAIRAGYSEKGANVAGIRMLANATVRAAVEERQAKRAEKLDISVDRIERELARIAFTDMRKYAQWGPTAAADKSIADAREKNTGLDWDEQVPANGVMLLSSESLTDDEAAAVAQVTEECKPGGTIKYGIKLHDKMKALELLGKRHGMWVDRVEHKHAVSWADLVKKHQAGQGKA